MTSKAAMHRLSGVTVAAIVAGLVPATFGFQAGYGNFNPATALPGAYRTFPV